MKAVENIFQKRGINYGWAMVLVVFTLSGLAFGSMASISVFLKPDQVSLAIGKGGYNIKLASRLVGYEIDVFRELNENEEEDVDLAEFDDEIEAWIIDELKKTGLDTAKSVLALNKEDLLRRTELAEDTIDEIFRILRQEFEQ